MKKAILLFLACLLLISLLAIGAVYAAKDDSKGNSKKIVGEAVKNTGEKIDEIKEKIGDLKEKINDFKDKIRENDGWLEVGGKTINIKEMSDEKKEIVVGKINAKTGLNLTVEDINNGTAGQIIRAYLSNGRYAIVKIMPDKAAETALKRLRAKCLERNCSVELKEIKMGGNKTRLAYEVETEKDSKILFIFGKKMKVRAQVDAETGEVISVKKPWWAFTAKEKNDDDSEIENELADVNATETGAKKVVLCHVPPGNTKEAHTIEVGAPAVKAHLAHGDYLGTCAGTGNETDEDENNTIINATCKGGGEEFSILNISDKCCSGLTQWSSGMDTRISVADACYETGLLAGAPYATCINCGNGVCDAKENPCNCASDCVGQNKSTYLSVDEFCNSAAYNATYCQIDNLEKNSTLCGLC